jgi:hypothetical protein
MPGFIQYQQWRWPTNKKVFFFSANYSIASAIWSETGANWYGVSYPLSNQNDGGAFGKDNFGNDMFLIGSRAAGSYGGSNDGKAWVSLSAPTSFKYFAYGNGIWVAAPPTGSDLYTSVNGEMWTKRTIPTSYSNIGRVLFGNGRFIMPTGGGSFVYSTDGISWTQGNFPTTTIGHEFISFYAGKFWSPTNAGVYVSETGISWSLYDKVSSSLACSIWEIAATPGGKIAIPLTTTSSYNSIDGGVTWTQRSYGQAGSIYSTCASGEEIIAFPYNINYVNRMNADGTWSAIQLPSGYMSGYRALGVN